MELADLVPLLDTLGTTGTATGVPGPVLPVPASKMEFDALADSSRAGFNYGQVLAPYIDRWYRESSEPGLCDAHGERFRAQDQEICSVTSDPGEILERLYVAVAEWPHSLGTGHPYPGAFDDRQFRIGDMGIPKIIDPGPDRLATHAAIARNISDRA